MPLDKSSRLGAFEIIGLSELGAFEIYVRKAGGTGGPWRVSTAGGAHPTWSRNTQELL